MTGRSVDIIYREVIVAPRTNSPTPLLKPWGDLADTVADLVKIAPDIAPRFMLLPRRGLHAIAVALHVAKAAHEPVVSIASRITHTHPRNLLREAMPHAVPQLYALFDRATVPAWTFETYVAFDRILRTRVASTLLEAGELTPSRIESAAALLEVDPVVWRARKAYRYDHERKRLATVVELLRSLHLLNELGELPDGAGRKSVYRRVRTDLARARASDRAFPAVPGWAKVETVGDLWEIGERLKICTSPGHWGSAGYALGLIFGQHVFLHNRQHDLLAQVQFIVGNVWTVAQIAGVRNRDAPAAVRLALDEALTAGGLLLVPSSADEALNEVLRQDRARDPFFDDTDDEGHADMAA